MAKKTKSSPPTNVTGSMDVVRYRSPDSKVGRLRYLEMNFSWSPPKDCKDQDYRIWYNGKLAGTVDLGATTSTLHAEIVAEAYAPTGPVLSSIVFGVKATQKKNKKSNYPTSDYATKTFHFASQGVPIINEPQVDTSSYDACTFSWSQNPYDNDLEKMKALWFTFLDSYEWSTVLKDSYGTPSDAEWSAGYNQDVTVYDPVTGTPVVQKGHGTLTGTSVKIYENQETIIKGRYRYFRVWARGLGGNSKPVITCYHYGVSAKVETLSAKITDATSEKTIGTQEIKIDANGLNNFSVSCQYAIVTPRVITTIEDVDPNDSSKGSKRVPTLLLPLNFNSWITYKTLSGQTTDSTNASFEADALDNDQVLFIRNAIIQNGETVPEDPTLLKSNYYNYRLPTPTISVSDIVMETHRATVTISGSKSTIPECYSAIYFRSEHQPSQIIAIVPTSTSDPITVQAPDWGDDTPEFGVRSFVGSYTMNPPYQILTDELYMTSSIAWEEGIVPRQPENVVLTRVREGVMQVKFDWKWTEANRAEISWSQEPDAWTSTDGPQTYVMSNTREGVWNISGLSAGTWYVRVRLIKYTNDSETYGMYSDVEKLSMSAAPDVPSLHITGGNPSSVTATYAGVDEQLTAFWSYKSNDGSAQMEAIFAEAEIVNDEWEFTEIQDLKVEAGTSLNFRPMDLGWEKDSTHYLSVRLRSMSDMLTDNWSAPVTVVVASQPSITLSGLQEAGSAIDENDELVKLPINFTVNGGDTSWTTTIVIERGQDTNPLRPDDTADMRFAGETIYVNTIQNIGSSTPVLITLQDLIGKFDDKCPYILRVTSKDSYGQISDPVNIMFTVNWDEKAIIPSGLVEFNHEFNVAFITPIAPTGAAQDAVCDIYRHSVDGLTRIAENLTFGEKYVDQYPTLGLFGGYRIVYKTKYGDYKTEDNGFAWTDILPYASMADAEFAIRNGDVFVDYADDAENNLGEMEFSWTTEDVTIADGRLFYIYNEDAIADFFISNGDLFVTELGVDYIHKFAIIIDFGGESLFLNANINLSDSWKKDFQLTRYLGGSMIGDWNPGVERSSSYSAAIPVKEEEESIIALRSLAEYSGVCRIRTPEGSNYFANIDVKDDRESKWVNKISKVSLTVDRVDAIDDEIVTYDKWANG